MKFHGTIQNGNETFPPIVEESRRQYLSSLKNGTSIVEEIKPIRPHKTYQQVKCHWGLVMQRAKAGLDEQGYDVMGVPLSQDMIQQILYRYCGGVGENGENKTLSKMNIDEASRFFENCRTFLSQFGIVIPEPDKNWRQKKQDQ